MRVNDQMPKYVLIIGPNLSHKVVRSEAAAIAVGSHDMTAFTIPFERSSGFFVACSAIVDSALHNFLLLGIWQRLLRDDRLS